MTTYGLVDLSKFADKVKERLEVIAEDAIQEAGERVVRKTPVDTGFARGSWFTSIGEAPEALPEGELSPDGSVSIARLAVAVQGVRLGQKVTIANNAKYIGKLEDGHSQKQAPEGMVKVVEREWQNIVLDSVNKVSGL